jgi:hypothetical protein
LVRETHLLPKILAEAFSWLKTVDLDRVNDIPKDVGLEETVEYSQKIADLFKKNNYRRTLHYEKI